MLPDKVRSDLFASLTVEDLRELGRHIDSRFVSGPDLEGLYQILNTEYGSDNWAMLRVPTWSGDELVAFVVRPRRYDPEDNDD